MDGSSDVAPVYPTPLLPSAAKHHDAVPHLSGSGIKSWDAQIQQLIRSMFTFARPKRAKEKIHDGRAQSNALASYSERLHTPLGVTSGRFAYFSRRLTAPTCPSTSRRLRAGRLPHVVRGPGSLRWRPDHIPTSAEVYTPPRNTITGPGPSLGDHSGTCPLCRSSRSRSSLIIITWRPDHLTLLAARRRQRTDHVLV